MDEYENSQVCIFLPVVCWTENEMMGKGNYEYKQASNFNFNEKNFSPSAKVIFKSVLKWRKLEIVRKYNIYSIIGVESRL